MRVSGKDTVHTALIDSAIGPRNFPDASWEACEHCTLEENGGGQEPQDLAQAPQLTPTERPYSVRVCSHLGGGQKQVSNGLQFRAQLDLLHKISAAVLRYHSLVQ